MQLIQAAVRLAAPQEALLPAPHSEQSAAMRDEVRRLALPWAALPVLPAGVPNVRPATVTNRSIEAYGRAHRWT